MTYLSTTLHQLTIQNKFTRFGDSISEITQETLRDRVMRLRELMNKRLSHEVTRAHEQEIES